MFHRFVEALTEALHDGHGEWIFGWSAHMHVPEFQVVTVLLATAIHSRFGARS